MNSEDILKISTPELLFSKGDTLTIEKEYKELAKKYHPDVSKNTSDVFAHINFLYREAMRKVKELGWEIPGVVFLRDIINNSEYRLRYKARANFEFGKVYYCDTVVAYCVDKKHERFFTNAENALDFDFASEGMKKEFARYLPNKKLNFISEDHCILIVNKTPDAVPLRGLKNLYPEGLDPKHVAWIMSSLHNMLCYLDWAKVAHMNINLDTYFTSYKHHTGLLLGGWWYSIPYGEKIEYVANSTIKHMRGVDKKNKTTMYHTDSALIRTLGIELMGKYISKVKYPELTPMIDWLLTESNQKPLVQFKGWDTVLEETFGERKFIKLKASNEEIYKTLT